MAKVKLGFWEYELLKMDRNEDGELLDYVIVKDLRTGETSKASCVLVVEALLKGNVKL